MAQFRADFSIQGNGSYAGDLIYFYNKSEVGDIPSDVQIDGNDNVNINDLNLEDYTVTRITKIQWVIDGFFYSDEDISHLFKESGTHQVQIKVWSELFSDIDGNQFYFTHTRYKDVEVKSRFLKLIKDNDPTLELKNVPETEDFYAAAAELFERIYKDTQGIFDLWDVNKIPSKFFEYISLTLGHDSFYSQKVGYNRNLDVKFSDYNIYDRIKLGAATPEEIRFFRRFLLFTANLFKSKGSPVNIEAFLSFFSLEGKAIELWTKTWGQTPIGEIQENFIGFNIEENKLNLAWDNIRAIGNCNENSFIKKTLNGIIIDNFHEVQKIEYDSDVVGENSDGWAEFELNHKYPYFLGIYKQDGNYLVPREDYFEEHKYYDIIPNDPVRNDVTKPEIIQINPEVLEYGDILSVPYRLYSTDTQGNITTIDSMLASRNESVKDCDISVKWRFIDPDDSNKEESLRFTEDELFVAVRGVQKDDDLYAHFNEYYRISVNGRRSTTSLTKIVKSDEDDVINQKINLSGDVDNPIYDLVITEKVSTDSCAEESECNTFVFNKESFYEILIKLNGSLISAYVRENDADTKIQENIDSDRGGSQYGVESNYDWTVLFENIDIDIKTESVLSLDSEGNDVISVSYEPILIGGNYGVGCRSSIIEIEEFTLDILDPDETLYDSVEKELNLKPKYLEWLGQRLLRFNNDRDNKQSFTNVISDEYDSEVTDYSLIENETEALEFIYFDNINATENIATRYSVTFDEDWLNANFSSPQDLKDKIIIPYGSQKMWWMPEQRSLDKDIYRNYYGELADNTCDTVSTTGTTGTTGTSGQPDCTNAHIIPGLHLYNNSTPLDTYNLMPNDDLSSLKRGETGTTYNKVFTWSEKMIQYSFAGKGIAYRGIFQEVAPLSSRFPSIDGTFELDDGELFENRVFQPIVYEGRNSKRVIGVRFKNCDDISRLIAAFSTDLSVDVQLYGEYEFELPVEAVKYRADRDSLTQGVTSEFVRVKIFIPLGVLSKDVRTYGLSTEFMHETLNSGTNYIRITGVYIRVPRELTFFRENGIYEVELSDRAVNPYESVELGLECKHFMSAEVQVAGGIDIKSINPDEFPTTYLLDDNTRNLLNGVAVKTRNKDNYFNCSQVYNYEDDFEWWMPKEVWRKRNITKKTPNVLEDILSNINYSPSNDFTKYFYNYEISAGSPKPKALTFSITDGDINSNTMYYAKVNVNFDFSGFSYSNIRNPEEINNALNDEELSRLTVSEGTKPESSYNKDFVSSPTATCLTFYVPISWYTEGDIPGNNAIEWFNYITGSTGTDGNSPSITMTPIGLMTYLLNNSGESNRGNVNSNVDGMLSVTKGWSIDEWNTLFDTHVEVEFIAEKIPNNVVKLFDKYSFNRSFPLNVGAFIDIEYNIADEVSLDWEVIDNYRMYSSGPNKVDFDVPGNLQDLRSWVLDVKSVTLNNFIVSPANYQLPSNILLRFNDSKTYKDFSGATLNGRWFFDVFFNDETIINTIEDEFNPNIRREITWLPYEADERNIFSVAKRKPSSDLVFNSGDSTYNLVSVNNEYAFQSINSNTALSIDYGKSGDGNRLDNEVIFSKDEQTNIKKLYMIDDNNIIFDIETTVYFDPEMNRRKNFKGKKFELVLKANNEYDSTRNKNVLGGYYFVGIGTFDFDISLGLARYNNETGKMEHSFLAGFGEYNTKGVKTGQWYKLRAIVTPDYIRVIFNDIRDPDRMVINYNIDNLIHDNPDRYNKGNFEELSYLVNGLSSLDITYPETLQDKVNNTFKENNYNEDLVRSYRPSGSRAGMTFFNELTYVGKTLYRSQVANNKLFGDSSDKTDLSEILNKIKDEFLVKDEITYASKTLKGNIVILAGDKLFYKNINQPLSLYEKNIKDVIVEGKYVVVIFNDVRGNDVQVVKEDFSEYKSIFVKDDTFYADHIYKYIEFTKRRINDVWVDNNIMHVEFTDVGSE